MSLPVIILSAGQLLVSKAQVSPQGIMPKSDDVILGRVEAVCSTCTIVSVGQYVMFKPDAAFGILSGGVYYIVKQRDVQFQETPPA